MPAGTDNNKRKRQPGRNQNFPGGTTKPVRGKRGTVLYEDMTTKEPMPKATQWTPAQPKPARGRRQRR